MDAPAREFSASVAGVDRTPSNRSTPQLADLRRVRRVGGMRIHGRGGTSTGTDEMPRL